MYVLIAVFLYGWTGGISTQQVAMYDSRAGCEKAAIALEGMNSGDRPYKIVGECFFANEWLEE